MTFTHQCERVVGYATVVLVCVLLCYQCAL